MALPSPNGVSQQRLRPYMPKLQYRNSSAADISIDSITPVSPKSSAVNASSRPISSGRSDNGSSPEIIIASQDALKPVDSQSSSANPSPFSAQFPVKRPKKKGKSFFNFFSVKEPSQQAFEDYQRYLRRKGSSSDGRGSSMGISGVSSAKMPPTVPKVNSKWDGVPQALKDKEKAKEGGNQSVGSYTRSVSTARSETSTRSFSSFGTRGNQPRYKLPSKSDHSLADTYGWESASMSDCSYDQIGLRGPKGDRSAVSRATSFKSLPEAVSSSFKSSSLPPHLSEDYLDVQLPPLPPLPSNIGGKALKGTKTADEKLLEPPTHCFSLALTPPELSPITPNRFFPATQPGVSTDIQVSCGQPDHIAGNNIKTTTIDIPSSDDIMIKSRRIPVLGPPVSAKRKDKHSPYPAGEATELIILE